MRLLLCALLCGCSVSMLSPEAAGPIPSGSSAIAPNSDPICGEGDRWNGQKCIHTDSVEQPKTAGPRLEIVDAVTGTGPDVRPGDTVTVHYVGSLEDGTKFDS